MRWIDMHCHLGDARLAPDLGAIIQRSQDAGVDAWVLAGVDPEDWGRQQELRVELGEMVTLSFGLHPWRVQQLPHGAIDEALDQLFRLSPHCSVIGETGLDFSKRLSPSPADRTKQVKAMQAQLSLANQTKKPVCLHIVWAHQEALEVIDQTGALASSGWVHAFSGAFNEAKAYIDRGLYLSIGGAVFKSRKLREALPKIPLQKILIETDAPDQIPEPLKDKGLNEPSFLPIIAQEIAQLCQVSLDELQQTCTASAQALLDGAGK